MRILIVGNGIHVNKRILPALKEIKKIDKITVLDRNVEKNKNLSEHIQLVSYSKYLKNQSHSDLTIIATSPDSHLQNCLEFYEQSKVVLIEKPITTDSKLLFNKKFSDLIKSRIVNESLMYLHHPLWFEVAKILKNKKIIKIYTEFSVPHAQQESFRYIKTKGGGSLNDQGIYPISLASSISKQSIDINNIAIDKQTNYEVDLGGSLELLLDNKIAFYGKWGLGKEYKNYLNLVSEDETTYNINFFYSKPDEYISIVNKQKNNYTEELKIGHHNQFKIMYEEAIDKKFNGFHYSTYESLTKRYSLYEKVKEYCERPTV